MTQARDAVYLAGPDAFRPDADAIGKTLKAMCDGHGLEGLWPLDNKIDPADLASPGRQINNGNLAMIRRAAAVVANISPFRGPHADCGTAFEIGYAVAMRKPVFAYTSAIGARHPAPAVLAERIWGMRQVDDVIRDYAGDLVEDFGYAENLMIACNVEPDVATTAAAALIRCARHLRYLRVRSGALESA
jgi:nucleoside 2-deoxyribosyltransferase